MLSFETPISCLRPARFSMRIENLNRVPQCGFHTDQTEALAIAWSGEIDARPIIVPLSKRF